MKILDILIVEDDPYMVKNLRSQLEKLGHNIIGVASSVAHATTFLSSRLPDMVILDIELSDHHEGGIVLAKIISQIDSSLPIIFYSDYISHSDLIAKAITTIPSAILSKSSKIDDLEANIKAIAFRLGKNDHEWFSPKSEGYYKKIIYSDIYWIRSGDKKIYITTENDIDIGYNITLSAFEKEHMQSYFIRIHQSWIINFRKQFYLDLFEQKVIFKGRENILVPFTKNHLEALKKKMNISKTR